MYAQRIRSSLSLGLAIGLLLTGTAQRAEADILTFTDRSAFLAAIQAGYYLEDFNDLLPGQMIDVNARTFSDPAGSGFGFEASVDAAGGDLYVAQTSLGVDPDLGLEFFDPVLGMQLLGTITLSSFTGPTAITALGGYFFADDNFGGVDPLGALSITVSAGLDTLTWPVGPDTSPDTFVGFISTNPFTALSFTGGDFSFAVTNDVIVGTASSVPEPMTLTLLGTGIAGLTAARRRGLRRA